MWLKNFLEFLSSPSTRRPPIRRRTLSSWTRFEALEDRCMLSAFSIVPIPLAPQDVNNNGLVVGNSAGGGDLWQNGELIDLGPVVPYAINDAGQVVGVSAGAFLITPEDINGDGAPDRWYRDDNQDGVNDLMTDLPGSIAYDINSSGQVIVYSNSEGHGFLWQNGELIDLGPVLPYAINDAGQVVGTNSSGFVSLLSPEDTNGDGTPDLWYRDANNDGDNDLIFPLGQWGLQYPHSSAISAGGQVVGMDGYISFLWTPSEPNGSSGSTEYLGTLTSNGGPVMSFDPTDVNASGRVIGNYWWSIGTEEGGFAGSLALLWENGVIYNLADLLPADSGLSELYSADAISDSGWIAGTTTSTAYGASWFVMIPTGEDTPPYIRISDADVLEGNSGTQSASFNVTLSKPSSQTITVSYDTADIGYYNAFAGSDYQAASGTLTFAPGETTKTITIQVIGDRLFEQHATFNETFVVNLSGPTNALMADGQAVGTILDDEPRISISDVTKAEGKNRKTTLFTFTVTLSAAYDQPVTMSFRAIDGSAKTNNNDYVAKSGTLTFAPGETTKTITIEVKGDNKKEANELFYLDLFGLSSNASFTKNRGLGMILNDD